MQLVKLKKKNGRKSGQRENRISVICGKISSGIKHIELQFLKEKRKRMGQKNFEETEVLFNIILEVLASAIKLNRGKIKKMKRNEKE